MSRPPLEVADLVRTAGAAFIESLGSEERCDLERVVISPAVPLVFERHFRCCDESTAAGSKCGQGFGERPGCAAGLSHIPRRVHAQGTHDSRSATIGSTLVARQAGM